MSQIFHSSPHESEIAELVQRLPEGEEETFWRQQLRGFNTPTLLGSLRQLETKAPRAGRHEIFLSKQLNDALELLARKLELSRDTIHIAVWANLLSRYSAESRALCGVRFISFQSNPERLWPVLLEVKPESRVGTWLQDTQRVRDDLRKREPVSERDLHLWCEVPKDQILVETVLDFTASNIQADPGQPLELRFSSDSTSVVLAYWTPNFSPEAVRRIGEQYVCLLEEITTKSFSAISELNLLPARQRNQVVNEWNSTQKSYPRYSGLQQLFEQKAGEIPGSIAVEFPREGNDVRKLTYRDLNARANQLARHLKKLGVGPDVVVGICAERSLEMLISVLGVVKAGAAYAPLDPTYPSERLAFMLEDTKAPVILTQKKFFSNFTGVAAAVFCVDTDWPRIVNEPVENLECQVTQENLAYLIYTSGSTGKPKGVAMRQGPLLNLLFWQMENWSGPTAARTLQFASLNFDVSFQEIFSTWCSGGTLFLITEDRRRDSVALARYLEQQKIERLFLPFVALKHLAEACEREQIFPARLREIITAGEQLQVTPQITGFFGKLVQCTLENQYGPSETHVVTAYRLQGPSANWPALPSIGRSIANTRAYILDAGKKPVPIGVPGELYLGGVCLARGYLNRPELTAEKFVADPFIVGSRMYKTGDLARWLPDGQIEFLGRTDHQVKVRGFRIELGEIESVLSRHPGVREAVVIARENEGGDKQLVAYLVAQNGTLSNSDLRAYLLRNVPSYCVPAAFVTLPTLPLTPNGKVDRRALPAPQIVEEPVSDLKVPQNPLEMQLKLVFEKLLQRHPIGTDVSFFEMGGDSLQALNLIVEIERATGKKLELTILYQAPTIERLAKAIQKESSEFSSLVPLQTKGTRPPLFLIHTTPGDVLGYGNLIFHLKSDQPCYGFQSLGFNNPESGHSSIEDMAAYYVKLLRKQQPRGPYHLGGWCYGGIVAVEMAHQLRSAGEVVAPLLLIETPAPAPSFANVGYYLRRVGCLITMRPRQWHSYLTAKFRYYSGRRTADEMRFRRVEKANPVETKLIEERNRILAKLERVYHTNLLAWQQYRPKFYPGKIVLFNAREQDPAVIRDPQYGWSTLAGNIETHFIPGNHDTILMEPHVRILADKINNCLLQAQPTAK
jgi:amino acid adenylation domain-containing protein